MPSLHIGRRLQERLQHDFTKAGEGRSPYCCRGLGSAWKNWSLRAFPFRKHESLHRKYFYCELAQESDKGSEVTAESRAGPVDTQWSRGFDSYCIALSSEMRSIINRGPAVAARMAPCCVSSRVSEGFGSVSGPWGGVGWGWGEAAELWSLP